MIREVCIFDVWELQGNTEMITEVRVFDFRKLQGTHLKSELPAK